MNLNGSCSFRKILLLGFLSAFFSIDDNSYADE